MTRRRAQPKGVEPGKPYKLYPVEKIKPLEPNKPLAPTRVPFDRHMPGQLTLEDDMGVIEVAE